MASIIKTRKALARLAANFGKPESWVDDNIQTWGRGLHLIDDSDLERGVEEWCQKKIRLPNLARFKELLKANPKTKVAGKPVGCPGCNQTGFRELARHYEMHKKIVVFTCVAACECEAGRRYESDEIKHWRDIITMWKDDPFTEAVYHSTAARYHLTSSERYPPELLAAMAVRAEDLRKSGASAKSSWSTLASSLGGVS
jgi:hypothetical protein